METKTERVTDMDAVEMAKELIENGYAEELEKVLENFEKNVSNRKEN